MMTFWNCMLDTLMSFLKFGLILLSGAVFAFVAYFAIEDLPLWLKEHTRKWILKQYRRQRRAERLNRIKNAKAIEKWCREDFYGDL